METWELSHVESFLFSALKMEMRRDRLQLLVRLQLEALIDM